jgi:plastocyanin
MHSDPSTRRRPRLLVRWVILVAALALLAAACGDDDSNGDADSDTEGTVEAAACEDVPDPGPGAINRGAVVNMIDFEFCQDDVTVEVGEAVEFIANGAVRHQVVHQPDDGDTERAFQSSSLNTGDSFLHQFDSPGTFSYICAFHPEMVGEITVVEG